MLIIDEFGYLLHDKEAGPLFYQVGVNGIIKTADYGELITAIYGGEKYPLMAVMDIPYEL